MNIIRCTNVDCDKRFNCFRYLKQTYESDQTKNFYPVNGNCYDYIENHGSDGVRSSYEADQDNFNKRGWS